MRILKYRDMILRFYSALRPTQSRAARPFFLRTRAKGAIKRGRRKKVWLRETLGARLLITQRYIIYSYVTVYIPYIIWLRETILSPASHEIYQYFSKSGQYNLAILQYIVTVLSSHFLIMQRQGFQCKKLTFHNYLANSLNTLGLIPNRKCQIGASFYQLLVAKSYYNSCKSRDKAL